MKRELLEKAREMRRYPTKSEAMLWKAVRNRRMSGVKFRRQHVIDRFIVDFYVPSHSLVVEIDGPVHMKYRERDREREEYLSDCGLTVIHFSSEEVEEALSHVIKEIKKALMMVDFS